MVIELFKWMVSWIVIFPSLYWLGKQLKPIVTTSDEVLRGVCFFALGLFLLTYTIVGLSLVGVLSSLSVRVMLGVLFLASLFTLKEILSWGRQVFKSIFSFEGKTLTVLSLVFLISFIMLLIGNLAPEIGGDALTYQLSVPKIFLQAGSLEPDYFDYNSYFPQFMGNLYLIGLATGGVFVAKFFHLFCAFLLFLAIRQILWIQTKNAKLSLFFALVLWLTPTAYHLASTTYIDVGLSLFTFLAVVFFFNASDTRSTKTFLLSGIFMGCATAIKYLSLYSVAALGVVWLVDLLFQRDFKNAIKNGFVWIAPVFLICGYWLIRNWLYEGNPFFPYFGPVFGLWHRPPTDHYLLGMGRGPFEYLLLYWNMFRYPNEFGSFPTRIGPFYFMLLPILILGGIYSRKVLRYVLFVVVFSTFIFIIAQADRWILPTLPVFAAGAGLALFILISAWKLSPRSKPCLLFKWVGVGLLGIYMLGGAYHFRHEALLYIGKWSLQDYRENMERTTAIADWMNENLAQDSKIFFDAEPRRFYFDQKILRHNYFKWRTLYEQKNWSDKELRDAMVKEGVTHILTNDVVDRELPRSEWTQVRHMTEKETLVRKVKEIESINTRDEIYRYYLYEWKL